MTPEVKKRIEQIRQGIVPERYVKDKDGIYPRDWASKKIGQWLKLAERSIVLQDEEEYQLVTIRRGFGGVDSRGSFLGKNVLVKNYFIVKTGDFIISKRQIAHGACGIVPPELDGAVVSNEYNVFLPQDGTNIQMFNLMMQLPHYKRLFYLMSDGVHIEKLLFKTQDWMKRTLAMPLLKEQKKIAEILATQDKTIELQGRKIEELKRFKKGCLEKMFPRKGQKVPEKRFPGFTDDWEQRKLGELYTKSSEKNDGSMGMDRNITVATMQFKEDVRVSTTDYLKTYYTFNIGDIAFEGHQSKEFRYGRFVENTIGNGIVSHIFAVFRPISEFDVSFWKYAINNERLMQPILSRSTKASTMMHDLVSSDFLNETFLVPSLEEQRKIGKYLTTLDHLITLHQRKLEEMRKQKKALMQLLLTGIVRVKA